MEKSDIYKLYCNSCHTEYVGQTFRNSKVRFKVNIRCLLHTSTGLSQFATI